MSFLKKLYLLALACLLVGEAQSNEEPPEVTSEPDFYNAPGFNENRAYDGDENILIDTFTGALQVHYTDLVVPGNGLDIVINRSYNSAYNKYEHNNYAGNKWSLHFGKLSDGGYHCDSETGLAFASAGGVFIRSDGAAQPLLQKSAIYLDRDNDGNFDEGTDYKPPFITPNLWRAECEGEQLKVTDDGGTDYYIGKAQDGWNVTKVEDVHGNNYTIDYSTYKNFIYPTEVVASDGRIVTLEYNTEGERPLLSEVRYQSRRVSYDVELVVGSFTRLNSVKLPDASTWQYTYTDIEPTNALLNGFIKKTINPRGLETTFEYGESNHLGNRYPVVESKCIELQCWTYDYARVSDEYDEDDRKYDVTTISGPDGLRTYKQFGYNSVDRTYWFDAERDILYTYFAVWQMGLLKSMTHEVEGEVIYQEENEWEAVNIANVPRSYSFNDNFSVSERTFRKPALKKKTITQDGNNYTYEVLQRDPAGWPEITKKSGNKTLYEETVYLLIGEKNGNWILQLPVKYFVGEGSNDSDLKIVSWKVYNNQGKIKQHYSKGALNKYEYFSNGALKTKEDGVGNITRYSDYYRGIPRREDYPDGGFIDRVVDVYGQVQTETNSNSISTNFSYDNMGRLRLIDNPISEDISIEYLNAGKEVKYKRGSLKQTNAFNYKMLLTRKTVEDLNSGKKFIENFEYDEFDRLIFKSRVNDPLKGVSYDYDALDRLIKTETTDGRVTQVDYVDGETRIITNPKNRQITYRYDTFSPQNKLLSRIEAPENVTIDMTYNELGQPLTISQNGVTREYDYNQHWQLNYYKEPEKEGHMTYGYDLTGRKKQTTHFIDSDTNYTTYYQYDDMGRLKETTYPGHYYPLNDTNNLKYTNDCHTSQEITCSFVYEEASIINEYDLLGQLKRKVRKTNRYVTKTKPFFEEYTLSSENSWSYDYDTEGRLLEEMFSHELDGEVEEYNLSYSYNTLDNLTSITYPSGYQVNYQPDVFGRPTKAGNIITSVDYYDSGSIKQMVYGNGHVTNYTLNEQLLPESMSVGSAGLDLIDYGYTYDLVGNLEAISDKLDSSKSISMAYDDLERLVTANGSWGVGSYQYDQLGNIEEKTIGAVTKFYSYDTRNRLESFSGNDYTYDLAGRVNSDGEKNYFYDHTGGMRQASGYNGTSSTVSMDYDANNRLFQRTQVDAPGATPIAKKLLYSQSGKLVHEVRTGGDFKRDHIYLGSKLVGYHDDKVECSEDLDGDGILHCYERQNGLDPYSDDSQLDKDGDGLTNLEEFQAGSRADIADTDGDGIPDGFEVQYGLNVLVADGDLDLDNDGITNADEYRSGLDPSSFNALGEIAGLKSAGDENHTVLIWDSVPLASGYKVYWGEEPNIDISSGSVITTSGTVFYHEVPELGKDYYYKVTAYNDKQETLPSIEVSEFAGTKVWKLYDELDKRPDLYAADLEGNIFTLVEDYSGSNKVLKATIYSSNGEKVESVLKNDNKSINGEELYVSESGYAFAIWRTIGRYHIRVYDPETGSWDSHNKDMIYPSSGYLSLVDTSLHSGGQFAYAMTSNVNEKVSASVSRFSPETGWSDSFVLSYPYEEGDNTYYDASVTKVSGVSINNQGNVSVLWSLDKSVLSGMQSYHMAYIDAKNNIKRYKIDDSNERIVGDISINDFGTSTMAWKKVNSDNSYSLKSQNFFSGHGITNREVLGTDSGIQGDYINVIPLGEHFVLLSSSDRDGTLQIKHGVSGSWSNALTSNHNVSGDGITVKEWLSNGGKLNLEIKQGYETVGMLEYSASSGLLEVPVVSIFGTPTIAGQMVKTEKQPDTVMDDLPGEPPQTIPGKWEMSLYQVDKAATFNSPPEANAGTDIVADEFTTITLDGRSSIDTDGQITEYEWSYIQGEFGKPKIQDAAAALTEVKLPAVSESQTIVFRLEVTDDVGVTDSDEVIITVNDIGNAPPHADAGPDRWYMEGDTVPLGLNDSYDPDSSGGLSYSWRSIDGGYLPIEQAPNGGLQFVAPSVDADKDYTLEITVTDSDGASSADTAIYTIGSSGPGGGNAPVADAGPDQTVEEDGMVVLDGGNSYDPNGNPLDMDWSVVSGGPIYLSPGPGPETVAFQAPEVSQPTDYIIRLTVTNSQGATASDDVVITVTDSGGGGNPSNMPPVADAGLDKVVDEETVVILDGRNSYDPDGLSLNLSWSVISGGSLQLEQGPEPGTLQFTAPNITPSQDYVLRLTVTDEDNATGTDEVTITVTDLDGGPVSNNQPPVANAGPDQVVTEGDTVIIDPRNSYDPDGYSLSLGISIVSGGYLPLESGAEQGTFQFVAPDVTSNKDYTLRITVTDADGASDSDDINVTVTPQ